MLNPLCTRVRVVKTWRRGKGYSGGRVGSILTMDRVDEHRLS